MMAALTELVLNVGVGAVVVGVVLLKWWGPVRRGRRR